MSKLWKTVLLALPCSLVGLGCVESEAIKYNNEVSAVTKELENLGKDYGGQLVTCRGNSTRLQELHTETLKRVDTIIQKGKRLTPLKTKEGKAYHQAFLSYLETEDELLRYDLRKVTRLAGANDFRALKSVLDQMQKRELEKVGQLKAAQQVFAKANNFRIE